MTPETKNGIKAVILAEKVFRIETPPLASITALTPE
jgi:hypothetical protein